MQCFVFCVTEVLRHHSCTLISNNNNNNNNNNKLKFIPRSFYKKYSTAPYNKYEIKNKIKVQNYNSKIP